ncbi:putative inorganic phosphate cotransporter [Uloborus diversus]|uniref:putative inorganic phosphate cotransporter n=1 Tax=Uloborus diversus TaxID=327109 RepID=UPI00240A2318|nr:putative inorganic phosphate cotransporter [Uloborus diversus]
MVRKTFHPDLPSEGGLEIACPNLLESRQSVNYSSVILSSTSTYGEFNWDSDTQGLILGSFFYGNIITQIPGGMAAEKWGAKWLFGIGVLVTAIFTLLTPLAARWNVYALIAARIMEGLGEGVTYPAMNAFLGRWAPKYERSLLSSLLPLSLSGYLSSSSFLGGWPSVFYVFGALGCVWFVFWIIFAYESPDQHPHISKAELNYIRCGQDRQEGVVIPWRSILLSGPVWALAITHFGNSWGFYTLLTELPTYLSNILHFHLKKNGVLSALPYLTKAVFAVLASIVADKLRAKSNLRITTIRRIINSIALYGPGVGILAVAFVGCNPVVIVVLLTLSVGFNGFIYSGFNVTHVDMSPEFAGTLMGITNCLANMSGFLAPAFVGWAVRDGQTLKNWGIVFVTTSAIYFFTGSIFNLFGSAELQPWGAPTKDLGSGIVVRKPEKKETGKTKRRSYP